MGKIVYTKLLNMLDTQGLTTYKIRKEKIRRQRVHVVCGQKILGKNLPCVVSVCGELQK